MKVHRRRELILQMLGNSPTEGLQFILDNPERVIWGAFEDEDGGGCVFHWLGAFHPETSGHLCPGQAFAELCGIERSAVIAGWDSDPEFRKELIEAIKLELFYRDPSSHSPVADRPRRPSRQSRDRARSLRDHA